MGVIVFREQEMRHPERHKQLDLFVKAYNSACDSINKKGVGYYRDLDSEKMRCVGGCCRLAAKDHQVSACHRSSSERRGQGEEMASEEIR